MIKKGADVRFIGLKNCDTCRKALKSLREAGIELQVIDVRADGLSPQDAEAIVAAFGDRAINRASTTWRGLEDAEKDRAPVDLLLDHPTILKRPAIEADGVWTLGWKADVAAQRLGTQS